ncbi:MAG: hypothetical protein QXI42_09570 [Thermoproteota archaeon]|nr:hypothetical protein [Candidatus Brockarchaeota archaeon]
MGKDCEDGKKGLLNPEALVKEAKASKYREAYKTLDSSLSYRIGVGVRLRSSENYSFFIEALFYLCPASGTVDLETLGKCLACLKELKKRGYSLTCQDGECVSCEAIVPVERVSEEYVTVKSLIANILNL